jgi:cytochrome c-type biogenesis protein CcmE
VTRKGRRLVLIAAALCVVGSAAALALYSLSDNIVFFYSPTEIVRKNVQPGARLRIGGMVAVDGTNQINVSFQGLPPDLFREGQGVVAEGVLEAPGAFHAETILAKHDERYMPREMVDTLKKQGRWQEGSANP